MTGELGKKILSIADDAEITHEPQTTRDDECIENFKSMADDWANETFRKFLDWLYDNGYLRPLNTTGTLNWDALIGQFLRDEGLIRHAKCRSCRGVAYEIDEGKFHCSICGAVFNEDECPKCGRKMTKQQPIENKKFTPFWICPCGYTTEAATND